MLLDLFSLVLVYSNSSTKVKLSTKMLNSQTRIFQSIVSLCEIGTHIYILLNMYIESDIISDSVISFPRGNDSHIHKS